jgi:EH_Signature domain
MRLMQALTELRAEPGRLRTDPVRFPIDPEKECAALIGALARMREESLRVFIQHPPQNPRAVWAVWEANGFDISALNNRQIRTLCTAEETALEPRLIEALATRPELLKRSICLFGIVVAYFSRWRTMRSPEKVEAVILAALSRHKTSGAIAEMWSGYPQLFSPGAADHLAGSVVHSKAAINPELELRLIPTTSALSRQVRARTAELAAAAFSIQEVSISQADAVLFLEWMIQMVWTSEVPTEAFYRSIDQIIMSKSAARDSTFRKQLVEYIRTDQNSLGRLGDPRLRQNMPKWRNLSPEAGQRFLSWLAEEYIHFFFNTILPDDNHNRRRKDFWLRYYRSIRDFEVAVSDRDLETLRRHFLNRQLPLFSRVNDFTASAFLMRFSGAGRDYVIVEFSETGHAAYIHEWDQFKTFAGSLRATRFDLKRQLKNPSKVERVLHVGGWERSAHNLLSSIGIRP